jgi:hypothetical protein
VSTSIARSVSSSVRNVIVSAIGRLSHKR